MTIFYKPHDARTQLDFSHTKPAYVVENLNDLHGPNLGIVTLPIHIDWTPSSTYDLSHPSRVKTMYSVILREATSEKEISEWIDYELFIKHWNHLTIPTFVKEVWETIHPNLKKN